MLYEVHEFDLYEDEESGGLWYQLFNAHLLPDEDAAMALIRRRQREVGLGQCIPSITGGVIPGKVWTVVEAQPVDVEFKATLGGAPQPDAFPVPEDPSDPLPPDDRDPED